VLNLQNYSSEIASNLETAESASIDDYIRHTPQSFATQKKKIKSCDQALEAMGRITSPIQSVTWSAHIRHLFPPGPVPQNHRSPAESQNSSNGIWEEFTSQISVPK
jgi:hypothetical protein